MFVYKNENSNFVSRSERKVNKIKLKSETKNSLKKSAKVSKTLSGKKKLTRNNKNFLEQLGFTLKK